MKFIFVKYLVPVVLLISTVFIMLGHYMHYEIGGDEPFSIYIAQYSICEIFQELIKGNNPPLFEILLHYWEKLFGIGENAVRSVTIVINVVALSLIYTLLNKRFSIFIAAVAVLSICLSSFFLSYMFEVRAYGLLMLFGILSTTALLGYCKNSKSVNILLLTISNILMVYTHYFGWFYIGAQVLWIFLRLVKSKEYKDIKHLLFSYVGVFISFLPIVLAFITSMSTSVSNGNWMLPLRDLGNFYGAILLLSNHSLVLYASILFVVHLLVFRMLYTKRLNKVYTIGMMIGTIFFFIVGISVFFPLPVIWRFTQSYLSLIVFCFYIVGLGVYYFRVTTRFSAKDLFLLNFLIFILGMFIISIWIPLYAEKYLSNCIPWFYIILVLSISSALKPRNSKIFIVLLVVSLGVTSSYKVDKKMDFGSIAEVLTSKHASASETAIVLSPYYHDKAFLYHYDRSLFSLTDVEFYDTRRKNKVFYDTELESIQSFKSVYWVTSKDEQVFLLGASSELLYDKGGVKLYLLN
ncbi:MAG: hypothetical protein COA58_13615 [Bacteroidetes bacterium]|nr:MAG: hypothetical protein COA58_13615 [Bacteroidota bacterium]